MSASFVDVNDPVISLILWCGVFILGLCLGSFSSAIIPRETNGQSWFSVSGLSSRSHCSICQKTLSWRELIPVFSYLIQRRKCACGQHPISTFYPVIEITALILTSFIFAVKGFNFLSLGLVLSLPFFMSSVWLNAHNQFISDRVLIILAYLAVGACLLHLPDVDLWASIYGAMIAGGAGAAAKYIGYRFSSAPLFGWDIVKLWVIIGFWLGLLIIGYFLFLMGLLGMLWILAQSKKFQTLTPRFRGHSFFPYAFWSLSVFYLLYLWF